MRTLFAHAPKQSSWKNSARVLAKPVEWVVFGRGKMAKVELRRVSRPQMRIRIPISAGSVGMGTAEETMESCLTTPFRNASGKQFRHC